MKVNQKGEDAMQTPSYLFWQLYNIFQFNYDAACDSDNAKCVDGAFYDKGIDGLKVSWYGKRVFCNPPFSDKVDWMKKAHEEVSSGDCPVCVMVLPTNSMDSKPWHDYVFGKYTYHIMQGRVSFIQPLTGLPQKNNNSGTTIVYFIRPPVRL